MFRPITAAVLIGLALHGAGQGIPFDLQRPVRVYPLPGELREISALTDVDAHTVACLHDGAARLYHFDLREGRVTGSFHFGGPGDMEGLSHVRGEYFALRSDGLLYRLGLKAGGAVLRDTLRIALPQDDLEGLGHDPVDDVLLVAPKGVVKGSPRSRDVRRVHGYDLRTGRVLPRPVLHLSVDGIAAEARRRGLALPMKTTDKGRVVPALKLRLSSVAVDPVTGHYHLLSATDRVLVTVDRQGDLVDLHVLDAARCPKPEGITFLPGGDMLLCTEGEGMPGTILRYARITPPVRNR